MIIYSQQKAKRFFFFLKKHYCRNGVLAKPTYTWSFSLRKRNFSVLFAQANATEYSSLLLHSFPKKMKSLNMKVHCWNLYQNLVLCSILQDLSGFYSSFQSFPPETLISFCSTNWGPSCFPQNMKCPPASRTWLYNRQQIVNTFSLCSRNSTPRISSLELWCEDLHGPSPQENSNNQRKL